jgi:uncharacterized protein
MTVPESARPHPTWLTAPFWEAARRRELLRPQCRTCQRSFFTPQIACTYCLSEDWEWVASSGNGTLYSFTLVSRPPVPGFEVPYILAIVDLDENSWSMLSRLVGTSAAEVRVGMPVCVSWATVDEFLTLPVFRPRAEEAG